MHRLYATSPASSSNDLADLSPFPETVVILLLAYLAMLFLISLRDRHNRRGSRLPVALLAVGLLSSCTPQIATRSPYGVFRPRPGPDVEVTVYRDGTAELRYERETLRLRRDS